MSSWGKWTKKMGWCPPSSPTTHPCQEEEKNRPPRSVTRGGGSRFLPLKTPLSFDKTRPNYRYTIARIMRKRQEKTTSRRGGCCVAWDLFLEDRRRRCARQQPRRCAPAGKCFSTTWQWGFFLTVLWQAWLYIGICRLKHPDTICSYDNCNIRLTGKCAFVVNFGDEQNQRTGTQSSFTVSSTNHSWWKKAHILKEQCASSWLHPCVTDNIVTSRPISTVREK